MTFLDYIQGGRKRAASSRKLLYGEQNVIRPNSFDDLQEILDGLKKDEGFVVDFDAVDQELAQRMIDFLSGAVYALSAKIKQIKQKTYLLLPKGLTIKTALPKVEK